LNNFFFIVNNTRSNYLNISAVYNDTPTNTTILSPLCGEYFNVGSAPVSIVINASDADDRINGNLSVDGKKIASFGNGLLTVNYTFSSGGNYQIIADAVNSRGERVRRTANVMAVDRSKNGTYTAACIDKPKDFENFQSRRIEFDASSSRGIRYSPPSRILVLGPKDLNFSWVFSNGIRLSARGGVPPSNKTTGSQFTIPFNSAGNNWGALSVAVI